MKNEKDTRSFGIKLGKKVKPGTVIALTGDLGTGKTTLTKAIAEGLGIDDVITSPTFNIVKEYDSGRLPLYHFDVYRIGDIDEMYELGYEEYFYGEGVCVIEWAYIIEEIIPEDAIQIQIEYGTEEEIKKAIKEDIDKRSEDEIDKRSGEEAELGKGIQESIKEGARIYKCIF